MFYLNNNNNNNNFTLLLVIILPITGKLFFTQYVKGFENIKIDEIYRLTKNIFGIAIDINKTLYTNLFFGLISRIYYLSLKIINYFKFKT